MKPDLTERPEDRVPTGVPGLDTVLKGGLLRHGLYMFQGRPGAGKTVLANQICFHHARAGGRVLYATLLAETHERLLFHVEPLSFFDVSLIPEAVSYLSAFGTLEEGGLKGLVEVLRKEAKARRATMLVVDGVVSIEESAQSKREFKKFIHELQVHANFVGCTVLLLTSSPSDHVGPEHTMVDGVFDLADRRWGRKAERELDVRKFRGSSFLRGGHAFQITSDGIVLYPRLEALLQVPTPEDPCGLERVTSGVASLDRMLHGGIPCSSSTMILGPTGAGKTSVGLHFLNQSTAKEPGLMFGFYETPARLLQKSTALGLQLEEKHRAGNVAIIWTSPTERILDALGNEIIHRVKAKGIKRLFVDGIDGLAKAAVYSNRMSHFFAALTNELRALGVTALYTSEMDELFATRVQIPIDGLTSLVENILLLRFVELRSRLHRMMSIIKVRDSGYDSALQELLITPKGIELSDTFQGAESIMMGDAKIVSHTRPKLRSVSPKRRGR